MSKVRFIADSSADLLKIKDVDFVSVPLTISTSERSFIDDERLDTHELLDYMEKYKDRSYTACPGLSLWLDAFEGADVIYVIALSSNVSGCYNSAKSAADMYLEEHPDVKIHVFDTLTTGPEMRLFVEKVIELDRAGLSFEEVIEQAEDYVSTTRIFFAFQSLHNLAQNGRVSKVAAAAVSALNINIVGTGTAQGELDPFAKRRGEKHAAAEILHQLEECGYEGGKVRICHTDNKLLAQKYAVNINNRYPGADIKIYESRGLISYYAERGGIILGVETNRVQFIEDNNIDSDEEAAE